MSGGAAVILGGTAALVALLANPLGIGHSGFGLHQTLLLAVGVVVATVGAVAMLRPQSVPAVDLAGRSRLALRSARKLWPFAIVAFAFAGLRLYAFAGVDPHGAGDTGSYELCAARALWNLNFYDCMRGWTLPLYYKLVGDDMLRIVGQFVISCAAWTYLAAAIARSIGHHRLRLVAFGSVLLFSTTLTITLWDGILLAESLSLSLAAVVVGAWLSFVREESGTSLVLLIAATVLWAFVRDSVPFLVLLTVPFILIWLFRGGRRRLRWIALGSMAAIFVAASLSADSATPTDKRWTVPMLDVIRARILPDREAVQHFEDAGMPVPRRLARVTDTWSRGDDWFENPDLNQWKRWSAKAGGPEVVGWAAPRWWAGLEHHGRHSPFYNVVWPEVPKSKPFQDWLLENSRETYAMFLVSHPLAALASTWRRRDLITSPPTSWRLPYEILNPYWRGVGRDPVPAPVEAVIYPQSFTTLAIALVAVIALAALVALRYGASITWWIPVGLIVTAVPYAALVWNLEPVDVGRHALLAGVLPRLGLLILLFLALDKLLRGRFPEAAGPTRTVGAARA